MSDGKSTEGKRSATGLTVFVLLAVVAGLVLAILVPASGNFESIMGLLRRWFFAIFCTLYALTQARVYMLRRHDEAHVGRRMPVSAFGIFTAVWIGLAIAAIAYGILEPTGWWEKAAWVVVVSVICLEMVVLGKLYRRSEAA
jgi:hypothetical protein